MPLPELDTALIVLAGIVLVAGLVRGFSGFGTGMIVMPVAAALYGPKAAIVIILIIDLLPVIPVTIPAVRIARWREVLPVLAGMALLIPVGVAILKTGDPLLLRWLICAVVFAAVALLSSRWRYRGPRGMPASFTVGGLAGLLGGIASIPGPPPILYWMASGLAPALVRANMMVLLFLSNIITAGNAWIAGLMTGQAIVLGAVAAPFYFAGLVGGWAMFPLASEKAYRRIAFTVIVLSTLYALPLFDGR